MPKESPVSWSDINLREKNRRRRIFYASLFIILFFVLAALAWAIIYSPLFRLKDIEITGNKSVSNDEVMTIVETEIYGSSFWKRVLGIRNILIWPESFSGNTLKFIPELKSVSVEKNYGQRKIKISIEERQPFGIWCLRQAQIDADKTPIGADKIQTTANIDNNTIGENQRRNQLESASDCFWFDSNGVIFKKSIETEGNLIVAVNDYSQKNIGIGSKILPDEFVFNILSVFRAISASGLSVREIRLNDLNLQEVEVDTYDDLSAESFLSAAALATAGAKAGPKIYFSLRFPVDNAADIIKSLKEKSLFGGLQYVDFRVGNRVYYK